MAIEIRQADRVIANPVVNLVAIPWRTTIHVDEAKDIGDRFDQVRLAGAVLADDDGRQAVLIEVGLDTLQVLEAVDEDAIEAH